MFFRKVAVAVLLAGFSCPALAQSIQLAPGQVIGNSTAAQRPSTATSLSPLLDQAFNSNQGSIFNRGPTVWAATRTPVLGLVGAATGTLGFAGITSGTMTISPQSVAGTGTLLLPNLAGTIVAGASSPLVSSATTGVVSCPTCVTSSGGGAVTGTAPIVVSGAGNVSVTAAALTETNDTNVTMTLGGTPATALLQAVSLNLGWSGQLSVARGGTGIASGTSGGILGFTGTGTVASSALLTANAIMLGGGAGATPTTMASLGTSSTVLHGNAAGAPSFGSVALTSDVSGILPLANGGTNAALTAANGAIPYSTGSALALLAPTATARLPLLSGASAAPVWGAYTLPATVTSGGIPCFTSTTAETSSAALAANALILGGGTGVCPSALGSLGTTTTLLHGNAAGVPAFSQVVSGDIATNTVANSNLAQAGGATIKGNPGASTANVQDFTIQGLTARGLPDATNDKILLYDNAAGTIKYVTPGQVAAAATAGVTSFNTRTGAVAPASGDYTAAQIGSTGVFYKINIVGFNTAGTFTYTPSTGIVYAIAECYGGGGGGGGGNGAPSTQGAGGGGGSGGNSRTALSAAAIGASKTVTIGAAGTGGAAGNNVGGAGGDTSLGTLCVGKGGSGGGGGNGPGPGPGAGGAGGVAGTGDIANPGNGGSGGFASTSTSGALGSSGAGGASMLGGAASGVAAGVNGVAATGCGSGGSGGYGYAGTNAGGPGSKGCLFITEYLNQ